MTHRFDDDVDGITYCSRCGVWQGAADRACSGRGGSMVAMVRAFHAKVGQRDAPTPDIGYARELRLRLIDEERKELGEALDAYDVIAVADALADLLYVVIGSALQLEVIVASGTRFDERDSLRAEVERLRTSWGTSRNQLVDERDSLRQQLEAAQLTQSVHLAQLDGLQSNLTDARRDLATAQRRIADLVAELSVIRDIVSAAPHDDIRDAVRDIVALRNRLEADRITLRRQIAGEVEALAAAQRRIAELEADGQRGCAVHHGTVHGGEAEELRKGVEKILEAVPEHLKNVRRKLVELLDRVDARDSLAHLELTDERDFLKARIVELEAIRLRIPNNARQVVKDACLAVERTAATAVQIEKLDAIIDLAVGRLAHVADDERDFLKARVAKLETEQANYNRDWMALRGELELARATLRAILPVYRAAEALTKGMNHEGDPTGRLHHGVYDSCDTARAAITPEIAQLMAETEKP